MTRTLLKKQILEVFSWVYFDTRAGKRRSGKGLFAYLALYLYLFGFLGFFFYQMADMMSAFLATDLSWVYMALMGLISVMLGAFGSIFNTYASLYCSKDNDLLLSMPIPASKILFTRLSGVYLLGLFYEALVMIPALIVFFQRSNAGILGKLFAVLVPIVLSFFILTISCALGYVVAWISSKIKHKNIVTVLVSLAFLVGYFLLYNKIYTGLQDVLLYADALGEGLTWVYPLYQLGLATNGNALAMLIGTAIFAALFLLTWFVLSHSFLKLATTNRGSARAKYREKKMKKATYRSALLRKEFRRLLGCPVYMLNCALGSALMVILAVLALWKGQGIVDGLLPFLGKDLFVMCMIAATLMSGTMNDLTAPSVSLEGKSLWLTQSLPVPTIEILKAKLKLHLWVTLPPMLILSAALLLVVLPAWYYWIESFVLAALFVSLSALIGLCLNLKMPNLKWQSETVPVKQSLCVMLSMFLPWGIIGGFGLLYWAVSRMIAPAVYLAVVAVILLAANFALYEWLKRRGTKIFESL